MQDLKITWNGAIGNFPCEAVGKDEPLFALASAFEDYAVSVFAERAAPKDAAVSFGMIDAVQELPSKWNFSRVEEAFARAVFLSSALPVVFGQCVKRFAALLTKLLNCFPIGLRHDSLCVRVLCLGLTGGL